MNAAVGKGGVKKDNVKMPDCGAASRWRMGRGKQEWPVGMERFW